MSEKILLLRYSDFHGVDTIAAHLSVIKKNGRCWWAKIGKQPSPKYLEDFTEQKEKNVLLYTPGRLHKCVLGEVRRGRPSKNYPNYYERDIYGNDNEPEVYFELLTLEEIDLSFLEDYVICCSGKEVLYDLKKTISSYMFIQHKSLPLSVKKSRIKKKPVQYVIDKNSCVYRKNGICTNQSFVSYNYECERPQYCVRQKAIKRVKANQKVGSDD